MTLCSECHGNGVRNIPGGIATCRACDGIGWLEGHAPWAVQCDSCRGSGRTANHVTGEVECSRCEGEGVVSSEVPYVDVWVLCQIDEDGRESVRCVCANERTIHAEMGDLMREYPDLQRRNFSIEVHRLRGVKRDM